MTKSESLVWRMVLALCVCLVVRVRAVARTEEHRYMLELHSKLERGDGRLAVQIGNRSRDLGRVTAVHSLMAAERIESPLGLQFRFNLSGLAPSEQVQAAELRLHTPHTTPNGTWHVYEPRRGGPHLLASAPSAALVTLDLTSLIRRWQRRRDQPTVILLQHTSSFFNSRNSNAQDRVRPNLIIFTRGLSPDAEESQNDHLLRPKRNVRNAARRKRKRLCSLQRMHVSFESIRGLTWIYAPSSYEAGICVGSCSNPLSNFMNATNHAHIQSMINVIDRDVPAPCCVPTKLAPLRMLYYDKTSDQVMLADYSDMIALECGCR